MGDLRGDRIGHGTTRSGNVLERDVVKALYLPRAHVRK